MDSTINLNEPHFGLHLTYDGYDCPIDRLSSQETVFKALNELPEKLGMHKLAEPVVYRAPGNNSKDPGGYSGFVVIQESHISIHTFDKRGFVSIDVYSCKDYDINKAVLYFNEVFAPQSTETNVVVRGKNYPAQNIY